MHACPCGRRQRKRRPIRFAAALAAGLLAGCGGAGPVANDAAPAPALTPGLWERASAVTGARGPNLPIEAQGRMIGPRPTQRICIGANARARLIAGPRCREREAAFADGRLRATYDCRDELGTSEIRAEGAYGPDGFDLRIEMANRLPDNAVLTLDVRTRARRIGPCPMQGEERR